MPKKQKLEKKMSETISVVTHHANFACVRFEGDVPLSQAKPYATTGQYKTFADVDVPVVVVNLTRSTIVLQSLPFATQVFDIRSNLLVMSTPKGGMTTVPQHEHAHWKTRLNKVASIATRIDGPVLFLIDEASWDEMRDPRLDVELHSVLSDVHSRAIILLRLNDRDQFHVNACGAIKRHRTDDADFDKCDLAEFLSTAPSDGVLLKTSPKMDLRSVSEYLHILFGAHKIDGTPMDMPSELTLTLPTEMSFQNDLLSLVAVSEHVVDRVEGVSCGIISGTLMFKVVPIETRPRWSVTVVVVCASLPSNVPTLDPMGPDVVLENVVKLSTTKSDSRMTLLYQMMTATPSMATTWQTFPDLQKIWIACIDRVRMQWDVACQTFDQSIERPPFPRGFAHPVRQPAQMRQYSVS